MLELTMIFNDGEKVECLTTTNPRVVELTATLSDATRTGINECDYCVILNNKPLSAFSPGDDNILNHPGLVMATVECLNREAQDAVAHKALRELMEMITGDTESTRH